MKIRRFFAKDMRTALNEVSAELGADAAILSSNKVNGGVEVVAAIDYDEAIVRARTQQSAKASRHDHRESDERANALGSPDRIGSKEISDGRDRELSQRDFDRLSNNRQSINNHSQLADEPFSRQPMSQDDVNTRNVKTTKDSHQSELSLKAIRDGISSLSFNQLIQKAAERQKLKAKKRQAQHAQSNFSERLTQHDRMGQSSTFREKPSSTDSRSFDHSVQNADDTKDTSMDWNEASASRSESNGQFPHIEWTQEPTLVAMKEELALLRTLLEEQVSHIGWRKKQSTSPIGVALEKGLKQLGLHGHVIEQLTIQSESEPDFECAWQKSLALLAHDIQVADDDVLRKGGVVALVGPTGVGKTTTLAKLAAKHVMKYGSDSVALLTTDSYRIAAYEQIKTFGQILRVPVKVVNDEHELKEALTLFSRKRLVLIDTAGMSQRDERLTHQMQCLAVDDIHVQPYLVLSATAQQSVLQEAIQLFSPFNVRHCIVTKLDEATSLGEIISTILDSNLLVAYTTDGQRVPEDIRVARAHHLVSKMVWLCRNRQQQNKQKQSVSG